jgi:hypothetical protein
VQYNERGVLTGDTLKRDLVIDYDPATWRQYLPAQNSRLAEYDWMTFSGATCQQNESNPQLATVTLNYRQIATQDGQGGQAPGQKLPEDYIEWSPGVVREDIRRHPKFYTENPLWLDNSLSDFWDDEKQAISVNPQTEAYGVSGLSEFIVGSCQVISHIFSWQQPGDPSSLFGKRAVPPGIDGDKNSWLIVSGSINPESGFWHQTLVYQYSDNTAFGDAGVWPWLYDKAAI